MVAARSLSGEQEAASAGAQLPSSAMGKAFSHTDKKVRDKAVAVFSKWISRQENLSSEVLLARRVRRRARRPSFVCACVRACCVRACVRAACVRACVRACMRAYVLACVCVCVRARVRACVRACVRAYLRACVHARKCKPVRTPEPHEATCVHAHMHLVRDS